MSQWTDPQYLCEQQYRDPANLCARAALHRRFSTNDYPWQLCVFDHLDLHEGARVLELGCGPGDLWVKNRGRLPASWALTLTDLSPGMVRRARQRLGNQHGGFVYATVDAQALPLPSNCFDRVIADHCVYHVPRRYDLLHEAHRVLVPGGRFCAATNGLEHMHELKDLVGRFVRSSDSDTVVGPFCLENGETQPQEIFSSVHLYRQENSLAVTDPEAVVDYVRSYVSAEPGNPGLVALESWVQGHIAAQGAFSISKDAGMFVATK